MVSRPPGDGVQVAALLAPGCMAVGPAGARLVRALLDLYATKEGVAMSPAARHLRDVAALASATSADTSADATERAPGHADTTEGAASASSSSWMSTAEAATRAGMSSRTVRRWAEADLLGPAPAIRGARRINRQALEVFLAEREAAR